jgi:hypothetical protein
MTSSICFPSSAQVIQIVRNLGFETDSRIKSILFAWHLIPQRYPGRGGMQQRNLPRQIPLAFSTFRPVLVCDTRAAALVL